MARGIALAAFGVFFFALFGNDSLAQQGKPTSKNPFGFSDVPNPDGNDVAMFAAGARLDRDDRDPNATMWTNKGVRGLAGNPSGQWASRWAGADGKWVTGTATVVEKNGRIYIFYKDDGGHYLIDVRRDGTRLVGRCVNTRDATDTTPWVGEIVSDERIDGVWSGGRWDLRRKLSQAASVVSSGPAAPPEDASGATFAQQIGFARQHLRDGSPDKAAKMVRASLQKLPSPGTGDARDLALAKGLVAYADGNLRATYDAAVEIHAAQRAGEVNVDAALLKSLVFVQKGVLPPAAQWQQWAAQQAPKSSTALGLAELLAKKGVDGTTYKLERNVPAVGEEGCSIDVWRSTGTPLQRGVYVIRKADDFRGAFALEGRSGKEKEITTYELRFYDLEMDSLLVRFYGANQPADEDVLNHVKRFSPGRGKDGATLVRAELEALRWLQSEVSPYAAQWARRAGSSKLVSEGVEKPLKAASKWTWEERGKEAFQAGEKTSLSLLTFVNTDAANLEAWQDETKRAGVEKALKDRGPLEHIHVVILAAGESPQYLGSAVLESVEPRSGIRLYYLSLVVDGERRRLRRYDDPLSLARVMEEARQILQERTKAGS